MLNVYEIFHSISGEVGAVPQGTQMLFIRLAGCNLKCHYCDTKESINENNGHLERYDSIEKLIIRTCIENVMFTGGEPLLQEGHLVHFIENFFHKYGRDRKFHIETNGTVYPGEILRMNCHFVFDYKVLQPDKMVINPGSYDERLFKYRPHLKFVVGSTKQLNTALDVIKMIFQQCRFPPHFSIGKYGKEINERDIFDYLKLCGATDVILNTQIHKYLDLD